MYFCGLALAFIAFFAGSLEAKNVCAVVQIRIKQQLTLERQAFDAALKITNDLPTPITNVKIDVYFKDRQGNDVVGTSDTNNTQALFYIRPSNMVGIDNVTGSGSIPAESEAEIHWLIIPSPGAAKDNLKGELYYVGATLNYTQAGKKKEMAIGTDHITVKPTPKLSLDYFITKDVYADNPLTKTVKETPEPFKLGVLVKNSGIVNANNVKIKSAQPKIIENKQDLLIDFKIIGSKVNGQRANSGLLASFGEVPAGEVRGAYWIMKTTLAGTFKEIKATVSHAENLGGQLTAIIKEDAINAHLLMGHVLNNQKGKDQLYDFLADDGTDANATYKLYETDGTVNDVKDLSAKSSLTFEKREGNYLYYSLTTPKHDGLIFVDIEDPNEHRFPVSVVTSLEGRRLPKGNAWTQFVREQGGTDNAEFVSHFRLFDILSEGSYKIAFNTNPNLPQSPIIFMEKFKKTLKFTKDQTVTFEVQAIDVNNDVIELAISNLPEGATFDLIKNDKGQVVYKFTWKDTKPGKFALNVIASDGDKKTDETIKIEVSDSTKIDLTHEFYDGFEGE